MRHGRAATSGCSPASSSGNHQTRLSAAGKVVLAAIVHHDTIRRSSNHQDPPVEQAKQTTSSSNNNNNTHDADKNSKRKFSRLFSKKKPTGTLIDKAQSGGNNSNLAPTKLRTDEQVAPTTNQHQRRRHHHHHHHQQQDGLLNNEQVIEFKFDLIVDQQVGARSLLDDDVDQLVESFALHSNDVCLMSTGKQRVQLGDGLSASAICGLPAHSSHTDDHDDEFNYLLELATQTLHHSFELLASKPANHQSSSGDNYSIELSATLLLSEPLCSPKPNEGLYSIVDLLLAPTSAGDVNLASRTSNHWQDVPLSNSAQSSSVDCANLADALQVVERIQVRLAELQRSHSQQIGGKLLLVAMKLKQRINGGLFSNRMCLIDFDPKFLELQSIFESIFNGQALAHLKRRKLHLQSLESMFSTDETLTAANCQAEAQKQHHLVASEHRLIQAEWLLYKQLSSALIRTLLVVHVHKLAAEEKQQLVDDDGGSMSLDEQLEHRLMRDNLLLLEFARRIQRASAGRLKRRKRNLKSHLASSNVSVVSNASANTTTCELPVSSQRQRRSSTSRQLDSGREQRATNRKSSLDVSLALERLQRRHRHSRANYASGNQVDHHHYHHHRPLAHLDATESSSMSTSSGSQTRRMQPISSRANFRLADGLASTTTTTTATTPLNNLSDSDSITSANLNSCSSSSYHRLPGRHSKQQRTSGRRDIELSWMAGRSRTTRRPEHQASPSSNESFISALQQQHRSSSISAVSTSPNVIQIDCCRPQVESLIGTINRRQSIEENKNHLRRNINHLSSVGAINLEDNSDNVSDICSVIAEPPKQLKLEEFLNQLSSIIAPITLVDRERRSETAKDAPLVVVSSTSSSSSCTENPTLVEEDNFCQLPARCSDAAQVKKTVTLLAKPDEDEEEEEDCKSHSSILDHLSSLANESNNKLSHRHQPLSSNAADQFPAAFMQNPDVMLELSQPTCPTGHLQRLLNSSSQLRRGTGTGARVALREPPETVEDRLRALTLGCHQPVTAPPPASPSCSSGAFTSSSNDSSCSSSSSTENKRTLTSTSCIPIPQKGASQRQNVKT